MSGGQANRRGWRVPIDLVAVVAIVGLVNLVVFHPVGDAPLVRAGLGIVFVLFVPGYALVAALFPDAGRSPMSRGGDDGATGNRFFMRGWESDRRGIDGLERVALSFGLSIALIPLLLVGLSLTPIGFASVPVIHTVTAITLILTAVAAVRRWTAPPDRRFHVPYRDWVTTGTRSVTDADSPFVAVLNVGLAIALVVAVGTLTFAVMAPPDGERFTEFYVMTENGQGELVAADYPGSFTPGQPEQLQIGIENHEQEPVEYAVVVQLQRVEGTADDAIVTDRSEVDRFSMILAPNQTSIRTQELTVSDELMGQDLRLMFLLYTDSVPETPTRANAYQSLHLWVDVGAAAS